MKQNHAIGPKTAETRRRAHTCMGIFSATGHASRPSLGHKILDEKKRSVAIFLAICLGAVALATETEHLGIRILPAPGPVKVDGVFDDWDLSGGVFVCSDAENLREKLACWFHLMYDRDNLYILARWIDETPLSNPGTVKGSYGFAGDCLQARFITHPGEPEKERTSHITAWRDRDGLDVVDIAYGKQFNEGGLKDAQTEGAVQEFRVNQDGRGYVQEISIPWRLLIKGDTAPRAGEVMTVTVEPNFNSTADLRISMKDIFKPGVLPDRVFTFMASSCWGPGTLEPHGGLAPPPVRLSDGRQFTVRLVDGVPTVDWTGLIKARELIGFLPIRLALPGDGFVSVQIVNAEGLVVRQLMAQEFMTKGEHEIKWDGLTTPNWRQPGEPVPAGKYRWRGLWHKGIGLRLKGWACNGGKAPWDSPDGRGNWGGDHGIPVACASDGERIYLGWSGAEAGKALLAVDPEGNVVWRCSRGGMSGAELVAAATGTVYAVNWDGAVFRVDARTGKFTDWSGSGSTDLSLREILGEEPGKDEKPTGLFASGDRLYVAFGSRNLIVILDAGSGRPLKRLSVAEPSDMEKPGAELMVVSEHRTVMAINEETGMTRPFASSGSWIGGLAASRDGTLFVGTRDPDNQIKVFDSNGREQKAIGRPGGRPLLGRWDPTGLRFILGMALDGRGQLWVMEADAMPKRVSVWDAGTGAFVREFFGPTSYGALGGAICPADPTVMVGQGCEWKLDAQTGRGACVSVITREGMENARFGVGSNGRVYLAVAGHWAFNNGPVRIFERVGQGEYRLRTMFYYRAKDGSELTQPSGHGRSLEAAETLIWSDENDDQTRQAGEISGVSGELRFSGWYMFMTADLTFYADNRQYKVAGFTKCGAPRYDLAAPVIMPAAGLGSADGRLVLQSGEYGAAQSWFRCFEIASGRELWTYPDNFVGVHGSHKSCPPEVGMIRGSFGPCGCAALPSPVGNIWVITSNVGEWHILTADGFYLTRLFQGDPMKVRFPEAAVPGAILDNAPPGLGGEDFGGSITLAQDGRLYLQAGKTGFWNVEVVGLDTVKALPGGALEVGAGDIPKAEECRALLLKAAAGPRRMAIHRGTPSFTGDLDRDFAGADIIEYRKQENAAVRSAAAWDDKCLYLGWEVRDETPWVNGASAPEFMYTSGDTVDFQLGTDAKADRNRGEAASGDLRLSLGNFQGQATAVLYRPKGREKAPKTFYSGVVREGYTMDCVRILKDARIHVSVDGAGKRYVVEAAVPLSDLEFKPAPGLELPGDFGVTHGDSSGRDTALRTAWSNPSTGIVNDDVFELKIEPRYWGTLAFEE